MVSSASGSGSCSNSNNNDSIKESSSLTVTNNTPTGGCTRNLSLDNISNRIKDGDSSSPQSQDTTCQIVANNNKIIVPFHPYKTEERSEFACTLCRFHHKRCDKLLPSCSSCLKSGKPCEYQNLKPTVSRKKKEKKKDPSPSYEKCFLINHSVNSTKRGLNLDVSTTLQYYNSTIFESIPKKEFQKLLDSWDDHDDSVSAYLFSIVSWAEQRSGSKQYSDVCFQHARLLVASHFDNHTNIFAGMSLLNFASHSLAKKRYKEASMYLDLVKYFVSDCTESSSVAVKNTYKWLELLKLGMHFTLCYENDGPQGVLGFFPLLSKQFLDLQSTFELPTDREKLPQTYKVIELCSSYIDTIIQKNFHFSSTSAPHTNTAFLIHLFVEKGFKLAVVLLADPDNVAEAWNLSLEIATHAATNPYFHNVPLLTLPFVDLAVFTYTRLLHLAVPLNQEVNQAILTLIQSLNTKYERSDGYSNVEEMLKQFWTRQ